MNLTKFRKLSPEERQICRGPRSKTAKSRERFLKMAEASILKMANKEEFVKDPEFGRAVSLMQTFALTDTDEGLEKLLTGWLILDDVDDGVEKLAGRRPAQRQFILAVELMRQIWQYPEIFLGYFCDEKGAREKRFIPGWLPIIFAKLRHFEDTLERVLCTADLSGKSYHEIVAMTIEAGGQTNYDQVKDRIRYWEA